MAHRRSLSAKIILAETILLLTVPVVLVLTGIVPTPARELLVVVSVTIAAILVIINKNNLKTLGIRVDNITKAWLPYTFFTLICVLGLAILALILNKNPLPEWWTYNHFFQLTFLSISALQEFLYRCFCQNNLQKIMKPWQAILLTTVLYSGMHILWGDPLVVNITFLAGLGWGYLWYKHRNLFLISLSHAVLNFMAIYLSFFPWSSYGLFKL